MSDAKSDPELWARLQAWCASPDAETLKTRIFRDLRMDRKSADAVVPEYARYAYLVCARDGYVTPPPLIARIAALHIQLDGYAEAFSRDTLGRSLPLYATENVPLSDPGHAEARAFYEAEFGQPAPTDIWYASGAKWHRILHYVSGAALFVAVVALALGHDSLGDGAVVAAAIGVGLLFVIFMVFVFTGPKRVNERPATVFTGSHGG